MIIQSKLKNYELHLIRSLSEIQSHFGTDSTYFVIDQNVYDLYQNLFSKIPSERLYLLEATEDRKNIQTALEICEELTKLETKRNTRLISVGGGITQDLTGFVANIMYRGIKWLFVPTTLLAAADSCIGGKTSLNYKSFKNLLGTFYPPDELLVCPEFFDTLTDGDFKSGLGEVVKFHVMMGKEGLAEITANLPKLLLKDKGALYEYVGKSLRFKKTFIEEDEFDDGKRIYLNFAHTFGHAIERSSGYRIPHGTAVAIGTLIAGQISLNRGLLSQKDLFPILEVIQQILPQSLPIEWFSHEEMMAAIKNDKKQTSSAITAILFDKDLKIHIVGDVKGEEIRTAVRTLLPQLQR